MDKQLIAITMLGYSITNFLTFCAMTYADARGGFIVGLLLELSVIMVIAFLNYIKLVKSGWENDAMWQDATNILVGLAPGIYFGVWFIIGVLSGIYLGWR